MNDKNEKKFDLLKLIELHLLEQNIIRKAGEINMLKKNERLQRLEAEFSQASESFDFLKKELSGFEQERKKAEDKIASNNEKIKKNEEKLFSGTITSSKELVNLQEEVKQLKAHNDELESKELELMLSLDEIRPKLQAVTDKKEGLESELEAARSEVSGKIKSIEEKVGQLKTLRLNVLKKIPREILLQYEQVRLKKGGIAVAVCKNNFCEVCGLEIPPGEAAKIKDKDAIYRCINCGRMLIIYREGIDELRAGLNKI